MFANSCSCRCCGKWHKKAEEIWQQVSQCSGSGKGEAGGTGQPPQTDVKRGRDKLGRV